MAGPHVFSEIDPYHAEALFYHADCSTSAEDTVFACRRLFGQPLVDDIPARKLVFSLWTGCVTISGGGHRLL